MISDYLRDAKRVTEGQYGELRVRKDYSYANTKFWRPGMVLVGDAACFVDPIFSSGVHLATYGALLAARSINSVLARTVDEETAFGEFEQRYRREYGVFYEFLVSFYDMNVNENSYFWSAKKVTDSTSSDLESFVSLVGGVSSGETALATASRDTLQEPVQRVRQRGGRARREQRAEHGAADEVLDRQAARCEKAPRNRPACCSVEDVEPETPLFEGGLVASPDGLSWSLPA